MVLCIDCKHFRITSRIEGDMCARMNEIIDDDLVYADIPCDFFESDEDDDMDGRLSERGNQ